MTARPLVLFVGDIAVAIKHLLPQYQRGIVSVAGELILPTGDERGFGNGTTVFEPFVAWGQILPRFLLQTQLGLELQRTDRRRRAFCAPPWVGRQPPATSAARGRRWWNSRGREFAGAEQPHIVPQIQITLNKRQHIMLTSASGPTQQPMWETRWSSTCCGIGSMARSSRGGRAMQRTVTTLSLSP